MPDPAAPSAASTPSEPKSRSYFNQNQLEDIDLAESVHAAARQNAAALAEQDVTTAWLDGFAAALLEARSRANDATLGRESSKQATAAAEQAARDLAAALQKIQSAAKQKHKMLAEDGDPATNFPLDGYLIGTRLNANRATLIQSATALIARATADSLPGFKTPERIAAVQALLTACSATESGQQETTRDKELTRIDRDGLIHLINTRRSAVQHAADALWPAADEAHRPIRKTFSIPLTRALGV